MDYFAVAFGVILLAAFIMLLYWVAHRFVLGGSRPARRTNGHLSYKVV